MATGAARLKRKNPQQGGKRKTNLTLTGLLMEGLGPACLDIELQLPYRRENLIAILRPEANNASHLCSVEFPLVRHSQAGSNKVTCQEEWTETLGALLKLITFPLSVLNFGISWLVINTPMLKRRITYHGGFQYAQHNVGPCSRSNRVI
jgi:hypothetical protein